MKSCGCNSKERRIAGLRAVWHTWQEHQYTGHPPLHSKCIGFALPGEYYCAYLMDVAALEHGEYVYGRDVCIGWPSPTPGAFRAYLPSAVDAASRDKDDAAHLYEWRGEYKVEMRPWYLHAVQANGSGSWTEPYADPVTGEAIVSYVCTVPDVDGAVVIAGAFAADSLSIVGSGPHEVRARL